MVSSHGRVLYVGGFELPDKNAAAQRVLGNAKALRELGYEVVFLDVSKEVSSGVLSDAHETEGFLTYSQCHATSFTGLLNYCCNPLHVEEVLAKHDGWCAVIAYNYPTLALWKLRSLCRKRGIQLYGDCTEWHTLGKFSLKFLFIQVDMFFRMRFVQKHLDGMIVISRYLENYYKKFTKTVVLPPLVDIQDSKWNRETVQPHSGIRLVYFGSPGPHKDMLGEIVKTITQMPQEGCLQIVGITEEQFDGFYPGDATLARQLVVQKKLKFFGRLPHREVLEIVKNSDYSIFYRHRTRTNMAGFPTKFVESISCGVPVITTDTSDLREYAANGRNAILLPEDAFEMQLNQLLTSPSGDSNGTVCREVFDFRRYVRTLNEFIQS